MNEPNDDDRKPADQHLTIEHQPSEHCIMCQRRLEEVGGKRLVAQRSLGLFLSDKLQGGGNVLAPNRSVKLSESPETYLVVRGLEWKDQHIQKAKTEILSGRRPWFCQECGNRTCSECKTPLRRPVASDVLYEDGSTAHVAILGADSGCSNPACSRYRRQD